MEHTNGFLIHCVSACPWHGGPVQMHQLESGVLADRADRTFAVKLDDGGKRGLYAVLLGLLERFGLLETCDRAILGRWLDPELKNRRERVVGRVEVLV